MTDSIDSNVPYLKKNQKLVKIYIRIRFYDLYDFFIVTTYKTVFESKCSIFKSNNYYSSQFKFDI
jgi:hypothetical protein